jgi:hypothetical protein
MYRLPVSLLTTVRTPDQVQTDLPVVATRNIATKIGIEFPIKNGNARIR